MLNILELDNNIRGKIGEELASQFISGGIRCKYTNPQITEKWNISDEEELFLKNVWKYLDYIRFNSNTKCVEIFEIKTRKSEWANKYKHAVSPYMMDVFRTSIRFGWKVKILEIIFYRDWNFSYRIKRFQYSLFSISKSRGLNGSRKRGLFIILKNILIKKE